MFSLNDKVCWINASAIHILDTLDWFLKATFSIDSICVLVVCGGFLSSSSRACVSTVHLEFVEMWILFFLSLCWHPPSECASQPGVFSLTIAEVHTHTMSSLVKSSGCFAVLRLMWCPHGPALRGPLRSLFLLLAGDPQQLLWLQCGWRASLSFPTHPFLSQGSREATQLLNPRCHHHCVLRLLAWLPHFFLHLWSYPFGGTPVRPSCWFVG